MVTEGTEQEKIADLNSRENLERILDEMIEKPEDYDRLKARIEEVFKQERTILILDMSGFTRTTQAEGIIRFMLMIHQMQTLAMPCIEEEGGILVRADADNLTCLLDSVEQAVAAGLEIVERLGSANLILPASRELYASIGIGHGNILNIDNEAIFGLQVNLASKLGEDLAETGEILLTEPAFKEIETTDIKAERRQVIVSGVEVGYYAILH